MKTTFLVAQNLAVSPFEVMSQDLEYVIMVVNYLLDIAREHNPRDNEKVATTEKERDKDFWSAL